MGDIRFRRLERRGARRRGDLIELSMPLPRSPNGMEYRVCPAAGCQPAIFQLGEVLSSEEWSGEATHLRRQPHTAGTTCPYCGHDSDDDHDFVDPKDLEALTNWFKWAAAEDAIDAFSDMLGRVGKGLPRGGAVSISVDTRRRQSPEPRMWREDLLRDLTCSVCTRRYGVYAIAVFCPDCGAPNLAVHFQRECDLISQQVDLAREAATAELGFRLLGNAHEDVVTALETYLKTVYRYLVRKRLQQEVAKMNSAKAIGNAFQNLGRARQKYSVLEIDPFAALEEDDLNYLRLNIEKRHVLGHNLGLSDEKYAEITQGEQPGQTVVLLAHEVERFATVAAKVVARLEDKAFRCD